MQTLIDLLPLLSTSGFLLGIFIWILFPNGVKIIWRKGKEENKNGYLD